MFTILAKESPFGLETLDFSNCKMEGDTLVTLAQVLSDLCNNNSVPQLQSLMLSNSDFRMNYETL